MVIGMATVKVTVTLGEEQLDAIQRLVAAGRAVSVSGFVQHAVRVGLHDAEGWREMLTGALAQTGGPLTARERAWADRVLSGRRRKPAMRSRRTT
jgi:Arc/MetJ-type ribon-helix-helix transcriptional regulator